METTSGREIAVWCGISELNEKRSSIHNVGMVDGDRQMQSSLQIQELRQTNLTLWE